MPGITPRTCLYPLTCSLLLTFGLSLGLTFRSNNHCYAGTCGEWLFPLQARIHVVVWYCWVSLSVTFLAIRAFSPELRALVEKIIWQRKIPVVGKSLVVSGTLATAWILALYGVLIGIWWMELHEYFGTRGRDGGLHVGNDRLAAVAMTGHLADVTMGMVLIPTSRHSALASFFKLSVSTTMTFHMMMAYTLFSIVIVHGFLYISWVAVFNGLTEQLRMVYPVLNPTYLYHETWPGDTSSLGAWRASLIFTGIVTSMIMLLIFITSLSRVRHNHFNLFYFTHLLGIAAVIIICLHASTMLYCTAPGLAMWLLDWGMRLYELRERLDGSISSLGNGWYCLSLQLPRRRVAGCACSSPLAHFYIHHSKSSTRELHPFTTITHLASQSLLAPERSDGFPIQFLFRKRGRSTQLSNLPVRKDGFAKLVSLCGRSRRSRIEWTEKLGGIAKDAPSFESIELGVETSPAAEFEATVRLEGPYFTPFNPSKYSTVVCLIAGSGISGAIAIASAFIERKRGRIECKHSGVTHRRDCSVGDSSTVRWERCIIIWSIRADDHIELPFLNECKAPGLELRTHFTGRENGRLDMAETLGAVHNADSGSMLVYLSGPNNFIDAGETACKALTGVDWCPARWDI